MIPTIIIFYILGSILNFIYLVETQQTSNSDQRMIMFCCSLAFPIYVIYLLQSRLSYFVPSCLTEEESPTPQPIKVESIHYGF